MMSFTIQTEISDERIKDTLTGAFEGGSNYWYTITSYLNPNVVDVECPHIDLPFMDGCGVMIGDGEVEDDEQEPTLLNREAIQRGLQVMADKYAWHLEALINENDDAETADVLLQCSLFGEIVYG